MKETIHNYALYLVQYMVKECVCKVNYRLELLLILAKFYFNN